MDELLADTPADARDLVKALLAMDPTKRLTAKQAMSHKYVEKYVHMKPSILPNEIKYQFRLFFFIDFVIHHLNWN